MITLRTISHSPVQTNSKLSFFINLRVPVKGENCQQKEESTWCPCLGAYFWHYHVFSKAATAHHHTPVCTSLSLNHQGKVIRGPPTWVPLAFASPLHFPPLTWVILSTETGIPSMVRGGSSELTSCGAGACSARADSKSSRIMLLYFRTCRELTSEVNKMPNNHRGLVPSNKQVSGAGLPKPLQSPKNKRTCN